jgi:hypothetical protein
MADTMYCYYYVYRAFVFSVSIKDLSDIINQKTSKSIEPLGHIVAVYYYSEILIVYIKDLISIKLD